MRRTGKLYTLTIISASMTVVAGVLLTFWNEGTSQLHLWLDIIPQGFGMASFITTTLIVSCYDREMLASFTNVFDRQWWRVLTGRTWPWLREVSKPIVVPAAVADLSRSHVSFPDDRSGPGSQP